MTHLVVLENETQAAYLLDGVMIGRYHRSLVNAQSATLLLVRATAPVMLTRVVLHGGTPDDLIRRHETLLRSPVGQRVDGAALAELLSVPGQVPGERQVTAGRAHWSGLGLTITQEEPYAPDTAWVPCEPSVVRRAQLH